MRRLTGDAAKADDLAQLTFLKAYEQQTSLKDKTSAKPWLFQISYRCFLDDFRKTARRQELLARQADDHIAQTSPSLMADIARAMDSLKPECRAVVMLCLAHGLTHIEAAEVTKLPLGTVKTHVSRGKTKLQAFLHAYKDQ